MADPGDGSLPWEPAAIKDRRLNGWGTPIFPAPAGSKATVEAVELRTIGHGDFLESALRVSARVVWPTGETYFFDRVVTRATRVWLYGLEELSEYLEKALGVPLTEARRSELENRALDGLDEEASPDRVSYELRAAGGPPLDALSFLQALDAVELWRDPEGAADRLSAAPGPRVSLPTEALREMLNVAFLAGRRVGDAEFPSRAQRARATPGALERSNAALAQKARLAPWVQSLIDGWPPGKRLSHEGLAKAMEDRWSEGPLAFQDCSDRSYVARELIPAMIAAALVNFPKGKAPSALRS